MHRRAFLRYLVSLPLLGLSGDAFAMRRAMSFDAFLRRSGELTGFSLSAFDRKAARIFHRTMRADEKEPERDRRILAFWYTGRIGERVVLTNGALGWQCLRYTTPPRTCHADWWSKPA